MFELLDTDKTGRIYAQDLTRFLLIIQKMRDYKFDAGNKSKTLLNGGRSFTWTSKLEKLKREKMKMTSNRSQKF